MADLQWYIVHTYSGFEERVAEALRQRADALDMADKFGEVRIPTETIVELKGGKKKQIDRPITIIFKGFVKVPVDFSEKENRYFFIRSDRGYQDSFRAT